MTRMAMFCSALLLGSACQAQTLTDEQMDKFKRTVQNADVGIMTTLFCPEGYQLRQGFASALHLTCWISLRILIDDILWKEGSYGRSVCPPPSLTEYRPLFDAITEYIIVKKPLDTERAATIASIALREKFPCPSPLNFR